MKSLLAVFLILTLVLFSFGCEDNDSRDYSDDDDATPIDDDIVDDDDDDIIDDDDNDDATPDDDDDDDDTTPVDDDTTPVDDDTFIDDDTYTDDDTGDDDTPEPPVTNEARADGFRLFYKERVERMLLSWNRYGMVGDAAFGVNIGKTAISIDGNEQEIVKGETDNNDIGASIYATWNAYNNIGGRDAELTLIRQFEGLAFYEAVSGGEGFTSREVIPGWTRVMDGVSDTVTRTRYGTPVTPPVTYPPALELEILDTFFDGLIFTYRENPMEYYWTFKPVNEMGDYAVTYVFSDPPNFLHISNCCGSWKFNQSGEWDGGFWGNHNSRDNFPDMSMGFLAAMDAVTNHRRDLPADVLDAAENAVEAGNRIGDRICSDDHVQMTIDEDGDLVPGGEVRPDGRTEWQDLGSFASCPMVYLAQAISTDGLDVPLQPSPMPGAIETSALRQLFTLIGLPNFPLPVIKCYSIDDAFIGMTWEEILSMEIFGAPWYEIALVIAEIFPDLFPELLGSTGDDFKEMELAVAALCYYADLTGKDDLLEEAKDALSNLIELHWILAELVYGVADSPFRELPQEVYDELVESTEEHLYVAAVVGRLYGIEGPVEDLDNFSIGESRNNYIEAQLNRGDTSPYPLRDDTEIMAIIQNELDGKVDKEPWIVERYWDRFESGPPIVRDGDGYQVQDYAGDWAYVDNIDHAMYSASKLMFEMALCTKSPWTLSCDWAALGCERPDLDADGGVDADDRTLFDAAYATYSGQTCDAGNSWCEGADLDHSGAADQDDIDFIEAATGCVY